MWCGEHDSGQALIKVDRVDAPMEYIAIYDRVTSDMVYDKGIWGEVAVVDVVEVFHPGLC